MIAGLDSSASKPTAAQLAQAKAHGVKMWCGYLTTRSHVNIGFPWAQADFARVKAAGLTTVAFCSGKDDPVACKNQAAAWGVRLCLDVEDGIRPDGPWVQDWLTKSGAGLYGHQSVFPGRRAPFYILTRFPGHDPGATWDPSHTRPNGPCGWQWGENRSEFGCNVDRGWYDDWFAGGAAVAPPFPYPASDYLALPSADPHCHSGEDAAEQANVKKWQAKMAERGWTIVATGIFDESSDDVCRKFQERKGLDVDGKVGPDTWRTTWTAPLA